MYWRGVIGRSESLPQNDAIANVMWSCGSHMLHCKLLNDFCDTQEKGPGNLSAIFQSSILIILAVQCAQMICRLTL